jgi:hypothetical protein
MEDTQMKAKTDNGHVKSFCGFCDTKYGTGVRRTVYLAAVWRAEYIEFREGTDFIRRINALQRHFDAYCKRKGIKSENHDTPLWKVAVEYFGGLKK